MENISQAESILQEKPTTSSQVNLQQSDSTGLPTSGEGLTTTAIPAPAEPIEKASSTSPLPENVKIQLEAEKMISSNVMSICLTSVGLVIRDEDRADPLDFGIKLSGVYFEGVQYYDLNGVQYINNTGMAILIDLLKALLEMGVEV